MKDGGVGRKEEWRPALETGDILVRREEEEICQLFKVKMTAKSSNHFYTIEVSQTEPTRVWMLKGFLSFLHLCKLKSELHSGGGHEVHNSEAISEFETNRVGSARHRVRCL